MMAESRLFEALFEVFPFGVYVIDVSTYRVCYINRIFKEIHGDCLDKICHKSIYEEDSPCYYCKTSQLIDEQGRPNNKTLIFERFNENNDRWYQHHEKTMCWPDGRVIQYSIQVDICELKEMQNRLAEAHAALMFKNKELMELNSHDDLTKVFNRAHLNQLVTEQLYKAERYHGLFSVVLMDIDDFKRINDNYGHLVGDNVLVEMAQLVTANIRQSDYFGRWGGEEFMLIVPHIKDSDDTKIFIEKLCNIIAQHSFSSVGLCTCSFGIAYYHEKDSLISLVKKADDALYLAKANGKNQVVVHKP